jgi:hypothetical protein
MVALLPAEGAQSMLTNTNPKKKKQSSIRMYRTYRVALLHSHVTADPCSGQNKIASIAMARIDYEYVQLVKRMGEFSVCITSGT